MTPPGWWAERPSRDADLATWLGLFVAALLLLGTGTPAVPLVAALFAVVATLGLSLRWRAAPLVVLVLLAIGLLLRLTPALGGFSDVLTVTQAAVRFALAGGNPYGIGYEQSLPPGAPFAYGPFALLWYLPSVDDPKRIELLAACGVLVLLALRGRVLGLAIYAVLPALLVTTNDGSNDTSAGLLLLGGLLLAERRPVAGGAALGLVAAFKPYALAWLPPLLAYGGLGAPLVAFLAGSVVAWGPAMLMWTPGAILSSLRQADAIHATPYYSLAWISGGDRVMSEGAWQLTRLVVGGAVALLSYFQVRSARSFVVAGIVIFVATLYSGWWSTFAYVAALAPIIAWHLDDWLGIGDQRVVWPGDPAGAVSAWADMRWPIHHPVARGGAGSADARAREGETAA